MSASREKKQRQGAGPSEKALLAQQQQAARKRKTITYTAVGVVIAGLVAALLIWNSGFFQARATAATVGDASLSTAELGYYYHVARNRFNSTMSMFGGSGLDNSKSDAEQMYNQEENKSCRDYFLESALTTVQQELALSAEAKKNGHTEAEVKEDVDAQIKAFKNQAAAYGYSYSAFLRANYGSYMNGGLFEKVLTRNLLAQIAESEKSKELSGGYSTDDLEAYYKEDDHADTYDTFEYSYLYFTPETVETKDKDGNDIDEEKVKTLKEQALADAKAQADEALKALKDGDKLADVAKKYDLKDSSIADHTTNVGTSGISSAIKEDLLKLKEGEYKLVENGESGYYVITFHGRERVDEATKTVRHILVTADYTTGEDGKYVAPTDEAWAAAKAKMNEIQAAWDESGKTEDDFAKLANEKSDDGGSNTKGGLYERNPKDKFVPEFDEWVFDAARKSGDVGMVQHSAEEGATSGYYGYHLIYYVGENEAVWMGSAREALAEKALETWNEEMGNGVAAALTSGADYLGK